MSNRLAEATSPYLRQHADNPVDWYPWGPEALERARREDRPLLLSIGYAACHWCHVMAHESFEDPATAEQMNRDFVNVKVDREERPDLDSLYMKAVQAFTGGHGGWPMTVFLTPDGRPFLGGTYFPPQPRHGLPSFRQVLDHAARLWRERRAEVERIAGEVTEHLRASFRLPAPADALRPGWLERLVDELEAIYDEVHGGWGGAPRFPHPAHLEALLVHHRRTGSARSRDMALHTLDQMARGGMADLLGGGFARYSVDEAWCIPHFEKMLYDNAQLAPVYATAWRLTGRAGFRRVAEGTLRWMLEEMRHPEGGFASSLDADTLGEEGLTATWTPTEVADVLGPALGREGVERACALLGVTPYGSFERGRSVLRLSAPWDELAHEDRRFLDEVLPRLARARRERPQPGKDEKVVVAWNGMAVAALARCSVLLDRRDLAEEAARTARFLLGSATTGGRLRRTWQGDVPGFLDDHAWLVAGLLELHQATLDPRWLQEALSLCDRTLDLFLDRETGVLATTGRDAEPLLVRGPEAMGGAEPPGQGVLAWAMVRLATLAGREDLRARAERVLLQVQALVERAPRAFGPELLAADWLAGPTWEVALLGDAADPALVALVRRLRARWRPFVLAAWAEAGEAPLPTVPAVPPGEGPVAVVCRTGACLPPARTPEELEERLAEADRPQQVEGTGRQPAPRLPEDPALWIGGLRPAPFEGRITVIDFWTSCCINCLHLLPELARLEEATADLPVQVVGVHSPKFTYERDPVAVARAVERLDIRHPVLHDAVQSAWRAFEVRAWPTIVVVDAEGRVAWRRSGEVDAETLERVVRRLLEEEQVRPGAGVYRTATAPVAGPLRHPAGLAVVRQGPPGGVEGARVLVTDAGHHRVVELALAAGEDGWPQATLRASWGAGQPGHLDAPGPLARFRAPQGVAWDGQAILVADTGNHAIRRIEPSSGEVVTVAGTGRRGPGGRGTAPLEVALRSPWGIAVGGGVVFVAMAGAHQVWALLPGDDRIGILAGSGLEDRVDGPPEAAAFAQPSGLALAGDQLLVADAETSSVRTIDLRTRRVGSVVGGSLFGFGDRDGPLAEARLQHPLDVCAADGRIYVADTFNHRVRVIDRATGTCSTLASGLAEPSGLVALGPFLLVADTASHRIVAVRRGDGAVRHLPVVEPEVDGAW